MYTMTSLSQHAFHETMFAPENFTKNNMSQLNNVSTLLDINYHVKYYKIAYISLK